MCGFIGEYVFKTKQKTDKNKFKELLSLSKNRGPSSVGIKRGANYQLGFNRLSVMDLSENGNQPMQSINKRYHMVFNGEVYNYRELSIKHKITNLTSSSDSEVVIRLVEKLGVFKAVEQLDGMFAIKVIDVVENKTYLVRDFAGIKPLFYGLSSSGIVSASQFNQIYNHEWFCNSLSLRKEIVKEYLGFGFMMAPNTIYKNIYQVSPGEIVTISKTGAIKKQVYLHFSKSSKTKINENNKQTVDCFTDIFSKSVKEQLNSDVPVATFLSGGIDSPLITAVAKTHKKDIKAYTIAVDDKTIDESDKASEYAKYLGVEHVIENINRKDLLDCIDEHFKCYPEPFGDYSSIPTYLITKKAAKKTTVMLSGDGADELFFGYPKLLHIILHKKIFFRPFVLRKLITKVLYKLNLIKTYAPIEYKKISDWVIKKQIYLSQNKLNDFITSTPFSEETIGKFGEIDACKDKFSLFGLLKQNEFYTHMQRVLTKVDRASMGNSLEVRVPFLSKKMIDFGFDLHPEFLNKRYVLKNILKTTLAWFIPDKLIYKHKKGFSVPMKSWLRNELKDDLKFFVFDKKFYGAEIINVYQVKNYVQQFIDEKHDNEWGVWHIYAWQKWAYLNKIIS